MILKDLGVQVGSKNRSKFDVKSKSLWEPRFFAIFSIFGQFLDGFCGPEPVLRGPGRPLDRPGGGLGGVSF